MPFGEEIGAGTGGRTTSQGYGGADGERQHFTGQQRDSETGLDFFNARYYSSTQGRFTTPDPFTGSMSAAEPQSLNRYTYVLNSPLSRTDPTGMKDITVGGRGSGIPGADGALGRAWAGEGDDMGNDAFPGQHWAMAGGDSDATEAATEEVSVSVHEAMHTASLDEQQHGDADPSRQLGAQTDHDGFDPVEHAKLEKQATYAGAGVSNVGYNGHGVWIRENGYTTVPKGVYVTLYVRAGESLYDRYGQAIDRAIYYGTPMPSGTYSLTLGPGARINNMTILPANFIPCHSLMILSGLNQVRTPTKLSSILKGYKGENVNVHLSMCFQIISRNQYKPFFQNWAPHRLEP
jgi:RHS repeat-associated protein